MARASDGTDVSISLGLSLDAQCREIRDILPPLARGLADFDNHVKTLCEAVGMITSSITSVEETVNALSAKMASFAAMEQNVSTLTENFKNSFAARVCNERNVRHKWIRLDKIVEHSWTF